MPKELSELRPSHPRFPICMYEHGGQKQCVFKRACSTLASTTTNTPVIRGHSVRESLSRLEETTRNSQGAIEYTMLQKHPARTKFTE